MFEFSAPALLFLLIAGHFVCDYPLQGEFLAKAKNFKNPITGTPWYQAMVAHSYIHSAAVFLITGSFLLALLEFIVHFATDCAKCAGWIDLNIDQMIHIGTKYLIFLLLVFFWIP